MTDLPDDPHGFAGLMQEMQRAEVSPQRSEMRRVAVATRQVIERLVATRAPVGALAGAAEALEAVAASLGGHPRGHSFEGFAESTNAGDPIFTAGRLFAGEDLTAEAEAIFVTVDFAKIAQMMARRAEGAAPPPG